jgi:hypothetical protein
MLSRSFKAFRVAGADMANLIIVDSTWENVPNISRSIPFSLQSLDDTPAYFEFCLPTVGDQHSHSLENQPMRKDRVFQLLPWHPSAQGTSDFIASRVMFSEALRIVHYSPSCASRSENLGSGNSLQLDRQPSFVSVLIIRNTSCQGKIDLLGLCHTTLHLS